MTQTLAVTAALSHPPAYWAELCPIPAPGSINSGLTYGDPGTQLALLGSPASPLPVDCGTLTNPKIRSLLQTRRVGNMSITLIKPALDDFEAAYTEFARDHPAEALLLGTAGGFCCRCVRGYPQTPSGHAFGTAVDLKVAGVLLPLGSPHVQRLLLLFYPYLHRRGFYWGADWARPDGMHFECSRQMLLRYRSLGLI